MEGQLLPGEDLREEDAPLLRGAVHHRGGQLYLLPPAQREDPGRLAGRHARRLYLHPQGVAPNNPRRAPEGLRRAAGRLLRASASPGAEARRAALPATAVAEKRPASPASLPRLAAHGSADGLRVPPQVLAVGRCLREPEAKKHCPVRQGRREVHHAAGRHRRLRLLPATRRGLHRRRPPTLGPRP